MKIGVAAEAFSESSEELDRIEKSVLESVGKPSEVFNTYAETYRDIEYWKSTHKYLKIRGFRPGKANAQVIATIIMGIKKNDPKCKRAFRNLYKNCVVDFMRNENSNLNKLMLEKELDGDPDSTEDIFRSIVKFMPLYDVKKEQLEDLYDVWHFSRINNLEDILSSQKLTLELVQEVIQKAEKKQSAELETLRESVEILRNDLENKTNTDALNNKIESIEEDISELKDFVGEEAIKFENRFSAVMAGKISSIEEKIKNQPQESREPKLDIETIKKIEKLEIEINKLTNRINEQEKLKHQKFKNIEGALFSEKELTESCKNLFKLERYETVAKMLHDIFTQCRSFFVDDEETVKKLFRTSFLNDQVGYLIMDPTTVEPGSVDLSQYDDKKIIVVKNIGNSFVEGVLIPLTLKLEANGKHLIFLIDDENLGNKGRRSLLKFNAGLSDDVINSLDSYSIDIEKIDKQENISVNKELFQVFANSNIEIGKNVKSQFNNIYNLLSKKISKRGAASIASQMVLYSYIESTYGKTKAEPVIDLVKGLIK